MRQVLIQTASALVALLAIVYNIGLFVVSIRLHGNDFGKFYYAIQTWRAGGSLYAPTIATHMQAGEQWLDFLNMNPPHFHLLVWPFASLPLETAAVAWLAVNVGAALIAAWLVMTELQIRVRLAAILPALALVASCGATGATMITGQFIGLLLLASVVLWRALRRHDELTAGMWLGVLISVKPFLGLFLPVLVIRREWRAAAAAVVAIAACFAVGVALFGVHSHLEWIRAMSKVQWEWVSMNGSLRALTDRVFEPSPYYTPLLIAPRASTALWLTGSAIVVTLTLLAARQSADLAFAATTLGALLVSPLGWVYYLWLALPGCVAVWRDGCPRLVWLAFAASAVPLIAVPMWQPSPLATLTIGSSYAWATALLWVSCIRSGLALARGAALARRRVALDDDDAHLDLLGGAAGCTAAGDTRVRADRVASQA